MTEVTDVNWTIAIICFVYLVIIMIIAILAGKTQRGMSDFFAGGFSMPFWVVALSVAAATMSGWGFVGMPGMVYQTGWAHGAMIGGGAATGMVLSFYLLAKPIRKCAEKFGSLTIPDILEMRYNSRTLRLVAALGILAGTIGYQSAQYKAFANMLQAIFPLTYLQALAVAVVLLTVYVLIGGIKSVIWTDVFETFIMLAAAIGALIVGLILVGGLTEANTALKSVNPDWTQLLHTHGGPMSMMGIMSLMLVMGIGYMGQPHVMQKFYTIDNKVGLKKSAPIAIITFLIVITAYYMGIWQRVLEIQGKVPVVSSPDLAGPMFVSTQLPGIMGGILFAGVIAAIMSTSGAFILVASSAILRDIIQGYILRGKQLDGLTQMRWSRWCTAFVIVFTVIFTIKPVTLVGWLGLASWGLYAATLTVPLVIGLWWRRATRPAAVAASLVGLVGGLGLFTLKMFKMYPLKMDPMGLAMGVAFIVFIVISLLTKQEPNAYFDS